MKKHNMGPLNTSAFQCKKNDFWCDPQQFIKNILIFFFYPLLVLFTSLHLLLALASQQAPQGLPRIPKPLERCRSLWRITTRLYSRVPCRHSQCLQLLEPLYRQTKLSYRHPTKQLFTLSGSEQVPGRKLFKERYDRSFCWVAKCGYPIKGWKRMFHGAIKMENLAGADGSLLAVDWLVWRVDKWGDIWRWAGESLQGFLLKHRFWESLSQKERCCSNGLRKSQPLNG